MRIPSIRTNIGRREMEWRVRLTPVDAIFGIICVRAKYYIIIIISIFLLQFTNPQIGSSNDNIPLSQIAVTPIVEE